MLPLLSFVWLSLLAASDAVVFLFVFGPSVSPSSSLAWYVVEFPFFSSCSCPWGEEEGTLFVSVVIVGSPLSLLHCVFSLLSALKLAKCTTTAVLDICGQWLL